jgi:UDP-glucose 4-epimerase
MKILVTGGAGYIGSVTVFRLISHGHEVTVFDSLICGNLSKVDPRATVVVGDIRDQSELLRILPGIDAVIHLAALAIVSESIEQQEEYFDVNYFGSMNLFQCARKCGVKRFIFASSCAVYGESDGLALYEDSPTHPINPYGASKLMMDNFLEINSEMSKISSFSLRFFNVSGALQRGHKWLGEFHSPETHLIPNVIKATRANPLIVFGNNLNTLDGTCIRDYVHVDDLVEAFISCLTLNSNPGHEIINLGSGVGFSIESVIATVERKKCEPVFRLYKEKREGDPIYLVADISKAQKILNWKPRLSLDKIVSDSLLSILDSNEFFN